MKVTATEEKKGKLSALHDIAGFLEQANTHDIDKLKEERIQIKVLAVTESDTNRSWK